MDDRALDHRLKQTARTVSAMRALGKTSRRGRIPKAQYSKLIESDYATHLTKIVDHAHIAIRPLIDDLPRLLASAHHENMRVDEGEGRKVSGLIQRARVSMSMVTRHDMTAPFITNIGTREIVHQHGQFSRQVKAALGVELWTPKVPRPPRSHAIPRGDSIRPDARALRMDSVASRLEEFVSANVAQIKSLGDQPLGQVEKLVLEAFASGKRPETLAKEILKRFEVAKSSARLIARSQLGRLHAQVAMDRQREIGLKQWQWMTVLDEAVRKEHAALHGKIYDYDPDGRQPPFLPGHPPNCRCGASPIFSGALAAIGALESGELDPDDDLPSTNPVSVPVRPPHPAPIPTSAAPRPAAPTLPDKSATASVPPFPHQAPAPSPPQQIAPTPIRPPAAPPAPSPAVVPQTPTEPAPVGARIGVPRGLQIGVSSVPGETEAGGRISPTIQPQNAQPRIVVPSAQAGRITGPAFRTPGEVPDDTVVPSDAPAPVGYESVLHGGRLLYRNRTSGRSYTPEQYEERSDPKRNGYGIELIGPNEQVPGFGTWEIKASRNARAEIRYRLKNGSGQAYSREQAESGEAVETEAWIKSAQESEAKRPGFLKRIGQWLLGSSRGR